MNKEEVDGHILLATGFEPCQFEPNNDPCDQCGNRGRQLYFGNRDYCDSREGDYYCKSCVIELHQENQIELNKSKRD